MFLLLLGFTTGCQPKVSEQSLSFLTTQKKPLTYQTVANQLGHVEPGPGARYVYGIQGGKKAVEFWMNPPPLPVESTATSIPVEIAMVVVRADGEKSSVIWPEELNGKDLDEAIAHIWPQQHAPSIPGSDQVTASNIKSLLESAKERSDARP
jgi:hypothetical protein